LPVEITSGELFRAEAAGELKLTRMKYHTTKATSQLTAIRYATVCAP
jgi:hypothetical protein